MTPLVLLLAVSVAGYVGWLLTVRFAVGQPLAAASGPVEHTDAKPPPSPASARKRAVAVLSYAGVLLAVSAGVHAAHPGSLFWVIPAVGALWLPLAVIDMQQMRLPAPLNNALIAVTALALVGVGVADGHWSFVHAAESAGVWGGFIGALWFFSGGRAMGFGDVRLAPSLGLILGWVGWGPSLVGLFAGFLTAALYGIGAMVVARARGASRVPFGPFLIVGACIGLAAGTSLAASYTAMTGLG